MLRQVDKFLQWNPTKKTYTPALWRRDVLPSWLTIRDDGTNPLPISLPAAPTAKAPLTIFQPYSSVNGADQGLGTPFEMRALVFQDSTVATTSADFVLKLKEVGEAREFMNNPCHIRTIAGSGAFPAILREPYMFLSQHNISATFQMVSGGPDNVRFYAVGAQYYPWSPMMTQHPNDKRELVSMLRKWMKRRQRVSPFWLTTDNNQTNGMPNGSVTIGAGVGTQAVAQAKIGDDSHFEAFGLCAVSTGGNFALRLVETKTKQTLMNGDIDQTNGMGTSFLPTIFPTPYLIPAGYRLQFTFTNLVAGAQTVFVTLFGRRIWAPITQVQEVLRRTAVPVPADSPMLMAVKPF